MLDKQGAGVGEGEGEGGDMLTQHVDLLGMGHDVSMARRAHLVTPSRRIPPPSPSTHGHGPSTPHGPQRMPPTSPDSAPACAIFIGVLPLHSLRTY